MEDVSTTLQQMQEKQDDTTQGLIILKNAAWQVCMVCCEHARVDEDLAAVFT